MVRHTVSAIAVTPPARLLPLARRPAAARRSSRSRGSGGRALAGRPADSCSGYSPRRCLACPGYARPPESTKGGWLHVTQTRRLISAMAPRGRKPPRRVLAMRSRSPLRWSNSVRIADVSGPGATVIGSLFHGAGQPPAWLLRKPRGIECVRSFGASVCIDQTMRACGALVHRACVRSAGVAPNACEIESVRSVGVSVCIDQAMCARGALVHQTIVWCVGGGAGGETGRRAYRGNALSRRLKSGRRARTA